MPVLPMSPVTEVAPADPEATIAHFEGLFRFETDCWDVHVAMQRRDPGFVLLDVRIPEHYAAGHAPGAVSLPYRKITRQALSAYSPDTVFVVYCDGPHCNGADHAAIRLAQ